MSFWKEVKRRKVARVVIAYLLVGWGLIQIADATLEPLRLPEWSYTLVVWLVGLGFPIAIVLGWVLDVTPQGIEVTPDESEDTAPPQDASIAVLPFVNMSGNDENEYFSDGLSEELLNLLVRLQSIRVCSRTSSFALKGKDIDMPTIAAQLGVRHVLEGSVRRSGDRVRITAQLIDAGEDKHLWSESYDRDLDDIFAVQDEIATHIFESLQITLAADYKQAMHSTTDNVDALDCYLRGRELYHRSEPDHLAKSKEAFEEAIRIDPNYALAWAGLTYTLVDTFLYRFGSEEARNSARDASKKAVELAPHLAESYGARGLALVADNRFEEAQAEFEKAIEINPNLFEPIHFYARMARSLGQLEKAAELFMQASQARPEDFQSVAQASNMYQGMGDVERMLATSREAVARAERAITLNPNDSRAWILGATCLQVIGKPEQARTWADTANRVDPESQSVAYNAACMHANMGNSEKALDYIEKAIERGSRLRSFYETDPDFADLQDHPRFRAMMDTL